MKTLVWLRNDLRMDDNPALREACKLSEEVHAIYIYSQKQNKEHNEANCKVDFFIENLKDLTKSLSKVPVIAPGRDDPLFEPPAMDATDLFHQASSHLHFQDRQLFDARTSC